MEYKSIASSVKDVDSGGRVVVGYFSAFGNKDLDGDIIQQGSFKKTIAECGPQGSNLICHLQDHSPIKAVGSIQFLGEDSFGLKFESKIGTHRDGDDYLSLCLDGIIRSHSIGYSVIKESKIDQNTNLITEIKLYEGSGIQFRAANPNTPVTGFKSFEEIYEMIKKLDKALHTANYSDETFILIEERLKTLIDTANGLLIKNTVQDIATKELNTKPDIATLPLTDVELVKEEKKIDYKKIIETAFKN